MFFGDLRASDLDFSLIKKLKLKKQILSKSCSGVRETQVQVLVPARQAVWLQHVTTGTEQGQETTIQQEFRLLLRASGWPSGQAQVSGSPHPILTKAWPSDEGFHSSLRPSTPPWLQCPS